MAENQTHTAESTAALSPIERVTILKTVADETRLAILALLAEEDSYVERIAAGLSLTPATVCYHLKKLESVGLVSSHRTQFYQIYTLNRALLDLPLAAFLTKPEPDADKVYRDKVCQSFFAGGRLTRIPAQLKKREIVLSRIAQEFAENRLYTESEVNEILTRYHEDYCTLRREMIACGFLKREHETYTAVGRAE